MEGEQNSPGDKYPWFDQDDERRHMMDQEILDKYIKLDQSCKLDDILKNRT